LSRINVIVESQFSLLNQALMQIQQPSFQLE